MSLIISNIDKCNSVDNYRKENDFVDISLKFDEI